MCQSIKTPPTILMVSCDQRLQEQRRILLQKAGYQVVSMRDDLEALIAVCGSRRFDLMFICHSVSDRNRAEIALDTRTAFPNLPMLMLYRDLDRTRALVKGAWASVDDPAVFMKTIQVLTAPGRRALHEDLNISDPLIQQFPIVAEAIFGCFP